MVQRSSWTPVDDQPSLIDGRCKISVHSEWILRSRWVPQICPVYTPESHTPSMVSYTCRYKSLHKIIEALVEYRAVFAGRCEICVHSDLTYYVDHAERSTYDGYTRQHCPCRIWWAILAVTSRYITLSRSNGPKWAPTWYDDILVIVWFCVILVGRLASLFYMSNISPRAQRAFTYHLL